MIPRLGTALKKGALCAFLTFISFIFAATPRHTNNLAPDTTNKPHAFYKKTGSPSKKDLALKKRAASSPKHSTAKAPLKNGHTHFHSHSHLKSATTVHGYPWSIHHAAPCSNYYQPHNGTLSLLDEYKNSVKTDATAELGKPYIWGGTSPDSGFDCSGFSQYVYKQEGIDIPRTALEQYDSLQPVAVPTPGDLVFFRLDGQTVSHVGIYLGNNYFIHSPATGQDIRIDKLNSNYWKAHYAGARRILTWGYLKDHDKTQISSGSSFDVYTPSASSQ